MPRFHPLNSVETQSDLARRVARLRQWMMEPTPSPLPALTERDHAARPWIAVLALVAFLGSQYAMPSLFMMDAAQAKEGEMARVQKARAKANAGKPMPGWYLAARGREAKRQRVMQGRLAQTIRAKKSGNAVKPAPVDEGNETPVSDKQPGYVEGSKPGQVKPSEAGGCKDCEVEMKALDLSRAPTEKELRMAGQLGGALSPIAPADFQKEELELARGKAQIAQQGRQANAVEEAQIEEKEAKVKYMKDVNLSFGQAIQEWNKHNFRQAARLFERHVKQYPESPWAGEAQLHLGCDAKYNGRFTEAEAIYQDIFESTSSDQKAMSFDVHQKSKARWADLDMARGRLDEAATKMRDIIATDTDWRRITWAQSWQLNLGLYQANARDLRACGTQALSVVLASLGKTEASEKLAQLKPTNKDGFSLAELERLAKRYGAPMRGFKATTPQLASLPTPFLVHYDYGDGRREAAAKPKTPNALSTPYQIRREGRPGHFLVAQSVDAAAQQVRLYDPQERRTYTLSFSAFEKEWSGTGLALVNGGKKGTGTGRVAQLSPSTMHATVGGCCGVYTPPPGTGCNDNNQQGNGSCGTCSGGTVGASNSHGAPVWSVNRTNLNLYIVDTPLWYKPAVGPPVEVTMSYNSQDSITQANPFGNKWMFNYGSYAVEDTGAGGGRVTVFMPDGSQDNYVPNGSGGYNAPVGVNSTLTKTGATNYTLEFEGGDKAFYAIPAGTSSLQPFLVELRDRFGYALTFGYNSDVKLTTITDAQGKVTNLTYDTNGHITRVVDPFERVASFSYDTSGNMIEAVDMEGHAFQYTYSSNKYVTQLNTAQGAWNFTYDLNYGPNRVSVTDPTGKMENWYYSNWNNKYTYTDKRGNVTGYDVDVVGGEGKVVVESHPDGTATYTNYSSTTGAYTSTTDARGKTTNVARNSLGRATSITKPKGGVTTYNYAANGQDVNSVVDALNQTVTSTTYNSYHLPVTTTDAQNNTTTLTYTAWGALATVTDVTNRVVIYSYDVTTKRLTSVSRGSAVLESYTYDNIGRIRTKTDAAGVTLIIDYNNIDQVTRVTYPDGTYVSNDYVCCGLVGVQRDRSGRKSYFDYDPMKRLVREQDATGGSIQYEYDAAGNSIRMLDAKGNLTRWVYDGLNRVVRKAYADGVYDEYTYVQGVLASKRNTRGQVTSYAYDNNGNVTLVDYPNMTDVALAYDAVNRVTQITDALGTTAYTRDATGRMTSVDGPMLNDTVSYTYDNLGRRTQLRINATDGADYGYDTLDRLSSVTSTAGVFGYSYIGNTKQVSQLVRPNGMVTNYAYDSLRRLASIANVTSTSANVSQYSYAYDTRDVRTLVDQQVGTQPLQRVNFGYDATDQLTSEASTEATPERNVSYAYDAMGNRTSVTGNGTVSGVYASTHTANNLNQTTGLSTVSGGNTTLTGFSYDQSGNMTAQSQNSGGSTYVYDDANRLVSIVQKNPSTGAFTKKSEFVYDALSRKVVSREYSWDTATSAWVQDSATWRVYDGLNNYVLTDCSTARYSNMASI